MSKIKLKRNKSTTFNKDISTEVLDKGEPFVDLVTNRLYVGDGTTPLKNLKAISGTKDSGVCTLYKGTHAKSGTVHTITLAAPLEGGDLLTLPVLVYYSSGFASGDTITLKYRLSATANETSVTGITLYSESGNTAVTDSFKANTVGLVVFYITSNQATKKAFITPAVSVWS